MEIDSLSLEELCKEHNRLSEKMFYRGLSDKEIILKLEISNRIKDLS